MPEIEKLLLLSEIFYVSIDFLIKNDENENFNITGNKSITKMTMDEVKNYLNYRVRSSWWIAIATSLLIVSPILLLVLNAISLYYNPSFSNIYANLTGIIFLFINFIISICIYFYFGIHSKHYKFLKKKELINLEKGVIEFVKERQQNFQKIIKL